MLLSYVTDVVNVVVDVLVVGMALRLSWARLKTLRNSATRGHQGSKKRRMQRQGLVHWSTRRRKDQKVEDVGYTVTKI